MESSVVIFRVKKEPAFSADSFVGGGRVRNVDEGVRVLADLPLLRPHPDS